MVLVDRDADPAVGFQAGGFEGQPLGRAGAPNAVQRLVADDLLAALESQADVLAALVIEGLDGVDRLGGA